MVKGLVGNKNMEAFIKLVFKLLFFPFWHLQRLIPRNKKLWVFGSMNGIGYRDNSRALFEYILKEHPEIKAIWLTRDKNICKMLNVKNINAYMLYSIKGIYHSLAAKFFITDHGISDLSMYLYNGAKNIYLWHGMPIKAMGLYHDENAKGRQLSFLKRIFLYFCCPYERKDRIDLLIVSSDFFKPFMSFSFANNFGKTLQNNKIVTTGLPRNDILFRHTSNTFLTELRNKYNRCKVMLYLPTFRLEMGEEKPFFPFAGFNFDVSSFNKFLEEENIVFLFKPHPIEAGLFDFDACDRFFFLNGNEYDDLYDFLGNIDILVTDYSSVYFDFILTNKPIILTPFDYNSYMRTRGMFYDYDTHIEGIKAYDWDDFMSIVRNKKYYTIDDKIFNYYRDADSCKRVYEAVVERWH